VRTFDFVIVGSGINALVCAVVLAKKGRSVCVLERNDRPGGCIRTEELTEPGFVHDVLSSWYPLFVTSPAYAVLEEDLRRLGVRFCNTDRPTAVVLPDNRSFVLRRDRAENVAALENLARGDGESYRQSLVRLEDSLDLTFTLLGKPLWTWSTARMLLRELWRRGPHGLVQYFGWSLQSARDWLNVSFASDLPRACLAPWVLHAGLAPESAVAGHMARVIAFTLEAAGCPVVEGGGYRLVEALRKLIEMNGGEVLTGADVEHIDVQGGRARGVRLVGGNAIAARRAVIASVTPAQLYTRLLDASVVPEALTAQARAYRHGRADMQIHLALAEPPRWCAADLDRTAIVHLTPGLDGISRAVNEADRGLLPEAGTIAVGQQAALDPTRVPAGRGLLWIQVLELPARIRGDAAGIIEPPADGRWTEQVRERYADRVIARLARHITNLDGNILGRAVLSPADLEAINCNLVGGDPYGGACTMDQFFLWRPLPGTRNHATLVRGLFHIGASTHPGPGLGGVSGFLVGSTL